MADKNLMSFSNDTYDGHGGKAEEHHAEMAEIARRVFREEFEKQRPELERMIQEHSSLAYRQAIKDLLHALEYDVQSITHIGFEGCREIFEDSRAQKFISDHIMKEIEKRLNGKDFRK